MAARSKGMGVEVRDLGEAVTHSRLQVSAELPKLWLLGIKAAATVEVKGMGKAGLPMHPKVAMGVRWDEATNREVPAARIVRAVAKMAAHAVAATVDAWVEVIAAARQAAATRS